MRQPQSQYKSNGHQQPVDDYGNQPGKNRRRRGTGKIALIQRNADLLPDEFLQLATAGRRILEELPGGRLLGQAPRNFFGHCNSLRRGFGNDQCLAAMAALHFRAALLAFGYIALPTAVQRNANMRGVAVVIKNLDERQVRNRNAGPINRDRLPAGLPWAMPRGWEPRSEA